MSKASEWVNQHKVALECRPDAYCAPPSDSDSRKCYAAVDDDGRCKVVPGQRALDPDIAIALAHWILDTFGEPDGSA